MAAEPRMKPVSGEPSSNGRAACAQQVSHGRADCLSVLHSNRSSFVVSENYSGDVSSLNGIIERFEGPLVRYAARITGDLERGRDVVQETFLRLCRDPAVATSDHLAQWLFTVCRRLALDVRRKEKRMSTQLEGTAVCNEPARPPGSPMDQREELGHVLRLLSRLPENQQEVVRLKFQEGMSYKQIASITGLSVSNVGYLLHVAVKSLRERINANDS